jgi:hypothetical protein
MSLRLAFDSDFVATFANLDEFGVIRTFLIVEDSIEKIFQAKCVWDVETLKTRMVVQQQGVYLGQVLCFIQKSWFKVEPKPEQVIYSPVTPHRIGWRVLDITDAEEVYELYLDKLIA